MHIGLLVTNIGDYGKKGFYNIQEIGLAKGLSPFFDRVDVYKLAAFAMEERTEKVDGYKNISIHHIPAKSCGCHGWIDTSILDVGLDILIYFSDTQLSVPKVFSWARKNQVRFFPYIGVIESHNGGRIKKICMDLLFRRVLAVYKRCDCLVKTKKVEEDLRTLGVERITVAPVGLDMSLMHQAHIPCDSAAIKRRYGFGRDEKILLFIGRLTEEKQPLRMIDIFADVARKDEQYRLLMVGAGKLEEKVIREIHRYGLKDKVKMIDRVPNRDIWELYKLADAFINLNQQEIFGMSILEAMYYGCKVIAWRAPGPEMIIEDGVSGWLVEDEGRVVERILDDKNLGKAAHEHILKAYTWENTAGLIKQVVWEDKGTMDQYRLMER